MVFILLMKKDDDRPVINDQVQIDEKTRFSLFSTLYASFISLEDRMSGANSVSRMLLPLLSTRIQ